MLFKLLVITSIHSTIGVSVSSATIDLATKEWADQTFRKILEANHKGSINVTIDVIKLY